MRLQDRLPRRAGEQSGGGARDARGREARGQADIGGIARQYRRCPAQSCCARGIRPDALTDQTSAHDPVNGYLPQGWTVEQWDERRETDPQRHARAAMRSMAKHVRVSAAASRRGACRYSTTATTCGKSPRMRASQRAFDIPGFVPEYIRPLFCRGVGPFRWAALSGDPEDIYKTDAKVRELIPDDPHLHHWLDMARSRIQFQGLAGAHLLGRPRSAPSARARVQPDGRRRRTVRAHRHRPRSSRLGLGRESESRDRGHARRLRCGLGLAAAQCAAQYRERRDLGLDSSWRRRRHGLLAARRRRHRVRRHRGRRRAACGACCGTIPATRRHAPRRCGL